MAASLRFVVESSISWYYVVEIAERGWDKLNINIEVVLYADRAQFYQFKDMLIRIGTSLD